MVSSERPEWHGNRWHWYASDRSGSAGRAPWGKYTRHWVTGNRRCARRGLRQRRYLQGWNRGHGRSSRRAGVGGATAGGRKGEGIRRSKGPATGGIAPPLGKAARAAVRQTTTRRLPPGSSHAPVAAVPSPGAADRLMPGRPHGPPASPAPAGCRRDPSRHRPGQRRPGTAAGHWRCRAARGRGCARRRAPG